MLVGPVQGACAFLIWIIRTFAKKMLFPVLVIGNVFDDIKLLYIIAIILVKLEMNDNRSFIRSCYDQSSYKEDYYSTNIGWI